MSTVNEKNIIRELENGLLLRRSSVSDADKLFNFNALIHGEDSPDWRVGQWARDLLELPHPTFGANDFTIVEEQTSGRIVSSLNLISQTWTYDGIPFGLGRPELVGTLPEYRRQGLVRIQMDEVHRWSLERNELVQAITGIPFYYRRFGYEMCVDLGGWRMGFEANLPKQIEPGSEPFRLRSAAEEDIPFLNEVYVHAARRSLLYALRDEALWKLELSGRSEKNVNRLVWQIIERTANGEAVGFLAHSWYPWRNYALRAEMYELKAGVSWLEVTPSVVRWMWELGGRMCESAGKTRTAFTFALAGSHPVYEIMKENLPDVRAPYAWYMRVPNLPAFIQRIAPVLKARLAGSLIPGYSGEIKLNLYNQGLQLEFERGVLVKAADWQPDGFEDGTASFPNQTFLQVLFGHRSLEELKMAYADCFWHNDEARVLVNTLFPRRASQVLGIV
ncbi:MAG TPA: GNAT family N-acetyltransferase [Anaerolineales bacterium]|jgi:hypothetical protein